jgi:hypothetical protein
MNKKVIKRILLAVLAYGIFVLLVVNFYDDDPSDMKWEDREEYNRQFINKLKLNQFFADQALEQLGSPDITEARKVGEDYFQVMFYRTQHVKSDGITTQNECSYLLFINDVLTEFAIATHYKGLDEIIKQYQQGNS